MNRAFLFLAIYWAIASLQAFSQNVSSATTPAAQVRLGNNYLDQKDYSNAMICFRQAAEKGNATAQNNVGWLYQNGWGVKQDYSEAFTWYRKAADQGDAAAQCNLGWLFRKGFGTKQDYSEAMTWFRKAANQGNAKAQANIAWLYEKGLGVDRGYAQAMTWYRKAADKGDAGAYVSIGWFYQNGWDVKQDYLEARTWYLQAADKGNPEAQTNLGWLYEEGLGVERDYVGAMAWYYRAAEKGDAQAYNNLGWLYENGLGVNPDEAKAVTWYRKAADLGNTQAKGNLSRLSPAVPATPETKPNDPQPTAISDKGSSPVVVLPNGIHAPRAINAPDPEYSEQARKEKIRGQVLVSLTVDPEGQPRDLKLLTALGSGLDEKALDAIKKWRFEPATKDGKQVAVQIMVEVTFRLYGTEVGRLEVMGDSNALNASADFSSLIRASGACWDKVMGDKAHTPSIKQGQVTVQFATTKTGRIGATEITSSSKDDLLDRGARDCVLAPKTSDALPVAFKGKALSVQVQFLYNGEVLVAPFYPQLALGGRKQFRVETAGVPTQAVEWNVTGVGCNQVACGTVSSDGLYTAPDVLPDPPYVRVNGTLAGANRITASSVVRLVGNH